MAESGEGSWQTFEKTETEQSCCWQIPSQEKNEVDVTANWKSSVWTRSIEIKHTIQKHFQKIFKLIMDKTVLRFNIVFPFVQF